MNGPKKTAPLFALASSLLLSTLTLSPGFAAERRAAAAPVPTSAVALALVQERARLSGAGSVRLTELAQALRTGAATKAAPVAVGTRDVAPGAASELAAATRERGLDVAALDALPGTTGGAEWKCLSEAIYFEARGEPLAGQIAVAEVILNRVDSPAYPKTVCGVTHQGVGTAGRACQFSYACDGHPDVMRSAESRARSEKLATLMIAGKARTVTDGATHFHAASVRPSWAGRMTRTAKIGHHSFYRPGAVRVASN